MRKFLREAKAAFRSDADDTTIPHQQLDNTNGPCAPTTLDVLRYRYSHGTNLGSIFVLEQWLTPHLYPENAPGSAELAAASASIAESGLDAARQEFEKHWNEYVSDDDLDWLVSAGTTSVRLPIGFFTLGPDFCRDTAFEDVAELYVNAWSAVERLVGRCWQHGIGTLLDLHAVPGGANDGEHSGTNSGKAEFWDNKKHKALAKLCLVTIAERARSIQGVLGLQLVNEAEHAAADKGMWEWYDAVASEVSRIDHTLPLYISDAWQLPAALPQVSARNSTRSASNPLVIDDHLYWCFSDADKAKTPEQIHSSDVPNALADLSSHAGNVFDRGATGLVVGEYSCVLADEAWSRTGDKDSHVRAFGHAQTALHRQNTGGSYFWTYRMNWMDGGEWGFKQMTSSGAITAPEHLMLDRQQVSTRLEQAGAQRATTLGDLFAAHVGYWDAQGGAYEHDRFKAGLDLGWSDAEAFFCMRSTGQIPGSGTGGDKIGLMDLWVLKRMRETRQGDSKFGWEFEQGFRQGIGALYEAVGI